MKLRQVYLLRAFLPALLWALGAIFVYAQTSNFNEKDHFKVLPLSAAASGANHAEPVTIAWHKAIGGSESIERAGDIVGLSDGGAIFTYSQFLNDVEKLKVQRINDVGENIWTIDLKFGDHVPTLNKILRLGDGSIIGVGTIWEKTEIEVLVRNRLRTVNGKFQPYAVKLNSKGEIIWQMHFPTRNAASLTSVDVSKDGGLIFAGIEGLPFIASGGRILILKVNKNGERIWQKTLGSKTKNASFMSNYFDTMIVDAADEIVITWRYGPNKRITVSAKNDSAQIITRMSQKGKIISKTEFKEMRGVIGRDALLGPDGNMIMGGLRTFKDKTKNGAYVSAYTSDNKIK